MTLQKKRYLLIPSVPTPNGRLHLGHIGGPFLRADIFARYVSRSGHRANILAGTDPYESYITLQAHKENKNPEEVCHHYHSLIAEDLALFDIGVSEMINPLEEKWHTRYLRWHLACMETLRKKNAIEIRKEKVFWDPHVQQFITGCRLRGLCPYCQEPVAGYFCEKCGAHFRPEEVQAPLGHSFIETQVSNLFMQLPSVGELSQHGISPEIEKIYQRFILEQKGLMRLTANERWGLSVSRPGLLSQSTFFNYGLMFCYFLLMGERAGELNGTGKNAFSQESDVITLATFGTDNAVPFLASIYGLTTHLKKYKPFNYYLVNYFYYLEGKKFSTSRGHAIWAHEIIQKTGALSDLVRLYLSGIDVQSQTGNMESEEFLIFYNDLVQKLNVALVQPFSTLKEHTPFVKITPIITLILQLIHKQETMFDPLQFAPHKSLALIFHALKLLTQVKEDLNSYFWTLKGFALLIYPLMPKMGEALWRSLGYTGKPTSIHFLALPQSPIKHHFPMHINPLTRSALFLSLPNQEYRCQPSI